MHGRGTYYSISAGGKQMAIKVVGKRNKNPCGFLRVIEWYFMQLHVDGIDTE